MRRLTLLHRYFNGARIPALVLMLVMILALLTCIVSYAEVENELRYMNITATKAGMDPNFFMDLGTVAPGSDDRVNRPEIIAGLNAESRVKEVNYIAALKNVRFGKKGLDVLLYTPGLMELFPGMKRLGIDFSDNPDGCVIIGYEAELGHLRPGDDLVVQIGATKDVHIPVAQINPKGQHFVLNSNAVPLDADTFLSENNVVILQATDAVMEQIVSLTSLQYHKHLIVDFQKGVTDEEKGAIRKEYAPQYADEVMTVNDIRNNTGDRIATDLKETLPLPLFLVIAALMAYTCIITLTFKRHEKDLAMYYLCGGSRRTCASITLIAFNIIALPVVFLAIYAVNYYEANDLSSKVYMAYLDWARDGPGSQLQDLRDASTGIDWFRYALQMETMAYYAIKFMDLRIDSSCYWIIFAFYGLTMVIAALVTWLSMRKHSPLTYLRGVNE